MDWGSEGRISKGSTHLLIHPSAPPPPTLLSLHSPFNMVLQAFIPQYPSFTLLSNPLGQTLALINPTLYTDIAFTKMLTTAGENSK